MIMNRCFINQHGVQAYVNSNGIYFTYPICSYVFAETYLDSLKMALNVFNVESLDDISGEHIMENNINFICPNN